MLWRRLLCEDSVFDEIGISSTADMPLARGRVKCVNCCVVCIVCVQTLCWWLDSYFALVANIGWCVPSAFSLDYLGTLVFNTYITNSAFF